MYCIWSTKFKVFVKDLAVYCVGSRKFQGVRGGFGCILCGEYRASKCSRRILLYAVQCKH